MRARHTPGPWKTVRFYRDCVSVVDTDGHEVVSAPSRVGPIGSHAGERALITPEEQAANARLIAAAPEMLEALTDLEWSGTTDLPGGGTGACCPECEGIAPDVRLPIWAHDCYGHAADCRIAAVITRATGEEATS